MDMTHERWTTTCEYLGEVFGRQDAFLAGLGGRAAAAGLPDIAVSAEVGRLLTILTRLAGPDGRGARLAIEVGTLGGYSGIWIARGLRSEADGGGRLVTIEYEPRHAAFARTSLDGAGVGERVEIRQGAALDVLPGLGEELVAAYGPTPVDLVFLDAVKSEYPEYFGLVRGLIRPGGLLVADNALGGGSWWIDESDNEHQKDQDGADRFNRKVASDPGFETACVPIRQGVVIARRL
jgi:predicted O-methyltransferase YrrM